MELNLPRPRTSAAALPGLSAPLSGFTDERNAYMSRCLDLLEPRGASDSTNPGHHDLEQQQKRRAAAIDKAFSEISGLIESKGREGKGKGAAAAAAGAADKGAEAEERHAKERDHSKEVAHAKAKAKAKTNRTATSRVQAKLELVRSDAAAKLELDAKVP